MPRRSVRRRHAGRGRDRARPRARPHLRPRCRISAPSLPASGFNDGRLVSPAEPFDRTNRRAHSVLLPPQAPWPRQSLPPLGNAANVLPVPAQNIFEIQEKPGAPVQTVAPSSRHAEQAGSNERETRAKVSSADTGDSRRATRRKLRLGHSHGRNRRHGTSRAAGGGTAPAAIAHRGPLKHLMQVKKRSA